MFNLLRLNLQFFADADVGGTGSSDGEQSDESTDDTKADDRTTDDNQKDKKDDSSDDTEKKITLTQAQLDKMMSDREKRALKDKEDAIEEAKKLAKMNADEKREYEFEKLQRQNADYQAQINRYELGQEATKMLSDSNIVATEDILDFVVREDADKTSEAVKAFSKLVDKVSDERMKEKLKGTSPKKQQGTNTGVTKESIFAIKDHSERIKKIQENPHLFN